MTYLKEFATQAEYDAFVESGEMVKPNVSLVNEPFGVFYNKRPESDVIEYHFEIPNVEWVESFFAPYYEGTLEGDFADIKSKVIQLVVTYSENQMNLDEETTLAKTHITVNGYRATSIDYNASNDEVIFSLGNDDIGAGETPHAALYDNSIYATLPQPYKPEIEYHFDIPMNDVGYAYEGTIDGNFSELYNNLVTLIKEKGEPYENGDWYLNRDVTSKKVNITVNGDKVVSLDFYHTYNEVNCSTTNGTATLKIYESSAYYETMKGAL